MGVLNLRAGIMKRESCGVWSLGEGLGAGILRTGSWGMNPGQMSSGRHHGAGDFGQGIWSRGFEAGVLGRGSEGVLGWEWGLGAGVLGWES